MGAALVQILMDVAEVVPYQRDQAGAILDSFPASPRQPVKAFWRRSDYQHDGRKAGILFCHDEVLRQISAAEQARPRSAAFS